MFLIYVVAFLDRANVAYAKLTMSADLGFSEAVYGFGAGVFFAGYLILEIPGALIVEKWGGGAGLPGFWSVGVSVQPWWV